MSPFEHGILVGAVVVFSGLKVARFIRDFQYFHRVRSGILNHYQKQPNSLG